MSAVGGASYTNPHFRNLWYPKSAPIQFEEFAESILDKEDRIAEILGSIKGLLARTK